MKSCSNCYAFVARGVTKPIADAQRLNWRSSVQISIVDVRFVPTHSSAVERWRASRVRITRGNEPSARRWTASFSFSRRTVAAVVSKLCLTAATCSPVRTRLCRVLSSTRATSIHINRLEPTSASRGTRRRRSLPSNKNAKTTLESR